MATPDVLIEVGLGVNQLKADVSAIRSDMQRQGSQAGKGFGDEVASKASAGIKRLRNALLGVAAVVASGAFLRGAIREANVAEEAFNNLTQALRSNGTLSRDALTSYKAFAQEIQRTTKFGDDAAIGFLSLANNLGFTGKRAEEATRAAIQLSAAFGVSVEDALKQLNGTTEGTTGRLAKLVPELSGLSKEALRSGAAIEVINQRLAGTAEAQASTFTGAIAQLGNAFTDLQQAIGEVITKSPALRVVISEISKSVLNLADSFSKINPSQLTAPIVGALEVIRATILGVTAVGEFLVNVIKSAVGAVSTLVASLVELVQGNFTTALEVAKVGIADSFNELFDFTATQSADAFVSGFSARVSEGIAQASAPGSEIDNAARQAGRNIASGVSEEFAASGVFIEKAFNDAFSRVELTSEKFREGLQNRLSTAFRAFRDNVGGAFTAIGQALARGENGFEAFGKAVLGLFADLAIQLGQFYLLLGIGNLFINPAAAAGQLAAGAALLVLGGLLKALSGGKGGADSGAPTLATGGGALQTAPLVGDGFTPDSEPTQRGPQVSVVVQGNVLDRRETGLALAEVIAETVGSNSLVVSPA